MNKNYKNYLKKLKVEICKVRDLEKKREICQRVSDEMNFGLNFKILEDEEVEKSFQQLKEVIICLK